jgi:hypothetical protein
MLMLRDDYEEGGFKCYYYLVDPSNRILFWLDDFDATLMLWEVDGATELSHIRE